MQICIKNAFICYKQILGEILSLCLEFILVIIMLMNRYIICTVMTKCLMIVCACRTKNLEKRWFVLELIEGKNWP